MIRNLCPLLVLCFATIMGCDGSGVLGETLGSEDTDLQQDSDSDTDTNTTPDDEYEVDCEDISLDVKGPSRPSVGDEWTIIMRCDGAVIVGPTVIRFTPPDFARTEGKTVVFTQVGSADMRVQVGAYRIDEEVVVYP